jgi:hypothetical protein
MNKENPKTFSRLLLLCTEALMQLIDGLLNVIAKSADREFTWLGERAPAVPPFSLHLFSQPLISSRSVRLFRLICGVMVALDHLT